MAQSELDLIGLGITGSEYRYLLRTAEVTRPAVIMWMQERGTMYGVPPRTVRALDYALSRRGRVAIKWVAALRDLVIKRLGIGTWEGLVDALRDRRTQRGGR